MDSDRDKSSCSAVPQAAAGSAIDDWLQTEHVPLAEQVDRLAADSELYRHLKLQRFDGPDYDYFETVLARYGQAVIAGWIHQGTIETKCREKRLRHVPRLEGVKFSADDIDEIVLETVAEALYFFRDRVLAIGLWDASKGASLRTYFIGQCLIRFVAVTNRWLQEQAADVLGIEDDVRQNEVVAATDVEANVINALAAHQALQHVSRADARVALRLQARGYSLREISKHPGRTEKAVESMIGHAKRQIRQKTTGTESA
ncbi:putative transcriptional rgulator [Mycolicibacterium murale]|uniref:Putative transcriptional rgulator n=1 Tax=Mycolicibacterium murale TaxID=182220 RepID=A0A7I9WDS9_9MYCO|nr:hypothetical protein [Mycolicibacterium murale]MCV7180559.1 hypothetical protein [Mycolicibacterium murale]GFG55873.1 putative transcriptional rgulator [Mycolicibacterium murale]